MEPREIKSIIADIVGIKVSNCWKIEHSQPEKGLYNIHYEDGVNMTEWGHIRGFIVDINAKKVICSGYEYTPIIRDQDELKFNKDGKMELYDTVGKKYIVDKNKIKIVPGFEVVTIRAYLHQGEIGYASYRKINIVGTRARWGDSIPFIEMGFQCKLPDRDILFPDKTKLSSNYAHIFMIVHRGILNVSKDNIDNGYIIYGGVKKMWDVDPTDSNFETVDTTPIKLETTNDMNIAKKDNVLFNPPEYNIEQANHFLKYGYYEASDSKQNDKRTSRGEFVIMYMNDTSDPFKNVLRIQSTPYCWSSNIKDDHPNTKYRFYQLANFAFNREFNQEAEIQFLQMFPIFAKFDVKTIVEKINKKPIHFWPNGSLPNIKDPIDRLYIVWVSLLMSVPLHLQTTVAKLYDEYIQERKNIADTLYRLYIAKSEGLTNEDLPINLYNRTDKMIELSKQYASRSGIKDKEAFDQQVKYNLVYLINGEEGASLHRIYKDCKALNLLNLEDSPKFKLLLTKTI